MDYIPHTESDYQDILSELHINSVDDLLKAIPQSIKLQNLNLEPGKTELEVKQYFHSLLAKNEIKNDAISFLGGGVYHHFIPEVISTIISRGEFLTAYTPYQPEISQGLLQSIFEFQKLVAMITGLDVSNASLYEGGTALVEAILMACNIKRKNKILISETVNPQYIEILHTYNLSDKFDIIFIKSKNGLTDLKDLQTKIDDQTAGVVIPYTNYFGNFEDYKQMVPIVQNKNALFISTFYPITSGLYQTPGDWGADIVVAEGQSLGIPLNFGGPYLGIIATKKQYIRYLPGRIVGKTIDQDGNDAFVLTLQAREQHIKRSKASSNICSNEALCALRTTIYLSLLGEKGLERVAQLCYSNAHYFYKKITQISFVKAKFSNEFFNEFVVSFSSKEILDDILKKLTDLNIFLGIRLDDTSILIASTELNTKDEIDFVVNAIENKGDVSFVINKIKDYKK